MKIHGLQKMTLLDFPGHVACTVFLGGCDFRCPFCHNFELVDGTAEPLMDDGEFFSFLEKRRGLLDGVAVTGGEPCLHPGLPDFFARVRGLGFMTKLDTNGFHPEALRTLFGRGLVDYVAMDIKNSPEKYAATCGLESVELSPIRESISVIMESGVDYEFRTTVIDEFHEESDFDAVGEMIRGAKKYFIQPFADRDSVPFGNLHAPSREKLAEFEATAKKYVGSVSIRGID